MHILQPRGARSPSGGSWLRAAAEPPPARTRPMGAFARRVRRPAARAGHPADGEVTRAVAPGRGGASAARSDADPWEASSGARSESEGGCPSGHARLWARVHRPPRPMMHGGRTPGMPGPQGPAMRAADVMRARSTPSTQKAGPRSELPRCPWRAGRSVSPPRCRASSHGAGSSRGRRIPGRARCRRI